MKSGQNVECAIRKVGNSADSEGQTEAQRYQSQNDAVDEPVDQGHFEHLVSFRVWTAVQVAHEGPFAKTTSEPAFAVFPPAISRPESTGGVWRCAFLQDYLGAFIHAGSLMDPSAKDFGKTITL